MHTVFCITCILSFAPPSCSQPLRSGAPRAYCMRFASPARAAWCLYFQDYSTLISPWSGLESPRLNDLQINPDRVDFLRCGPSEFDIWLAGHFQPLLTSNIFETKFDTVRVDFSECRHTVLLNMLSSSACSLWPQVLCLVPSQFFGSKTETHQ